MSNFHALIVTPESVVSTKEQSMTGSISGGVLGLDESSSSMCGRLLSLTA